MVHSDVKILEVFFSAAVKQSSGKWELYMSMHAHHPLSSAHLHRSSSTVKEASTVSGERERRDKVCETAYAPGGFKSDRKRLISCTKKWDRRKGNGQTQKTRCGQCHAVINKQTSTELFAHTVMFKVQSFANCNFYSLYLSSFFSQ